MKKQILNYSFIEKMIISLLLMACSSSLFAQQGNVASLIGSAVPPANDDLCGAISITVDDACALEDYPYTNIDATIEASEPVGCEFGTFQSVWFSFEAPSTGYVDIYVTDNSTGEDYEIHVFEEGGGFVCSDLSTLDEIDCVEADDLEVSGLTSGDTYYIRIQLVDPNEDYFCIEIIEIIPPDNDDLCDATMLIMDELCVGNIYNNSNATNEAGDQVECLGSLECPTVWFSFTAPPTGCASIQTDSPFNELYEVVLYEIGGGFDCASGSDMTDVDCVINDMDVCGLNPGETYYVRLIGGDVVGESEHKNYSSSSCGADPVDYCIEVSTITPPENDDLCDAIFIDVDESCGGYEYTNFYASDEAEPGACGGEVYGTVWFEFQSPCSGSVDIVLDTEFGSDVEVAIFQENLDFDCSTNISLTEIACDWDVLGIFSVSGLSTEEYYYVRVQTIPNIGENFCIEINTPDGPTNDFLCNAIELTVNDHCDGNLYNNIDATAGPSEPAVGCTGGGLASFQTVWFSFQAPAEGYVVIITDQDEDIVRNLYHCGGGECDDPGTLIFAGCESSDNYYLTETGMTPGDWYYIRVRVDAPPYETEFCIEVLTPPVNDELCEHIELTLGADCIGYEYTNENATISPSPFDEVNEAPGCGNGLENTVWFTFETPASGDIAIKTEAAGGANVERHVYSWEFDDSECDGYYLIELECSEDDTDDIWYISGLDTNEDEHILSIQTLDDPEGVEFCVEILDPAPENDDLCNAIALTLDEPCTDFEYTNEFATTEPGESSACDGDPSDKTVWFSFVAPPSGTVEIITSPQDVGEPQISRTVYCEDFGFDCSDLSTLDKIDCNYDTGGDLHELEITDLCPGETHYVQIQLTGPPYEDEFCIEINEIFPPDNDDICDAEFIEIGDNCSPYEYSNFGSTLEGGEPGGCGPDNNSSVWFYFYAPPSGSVNITTSSSSLLIERHVFKPDPEASCNSFVTLEDIICQNDNDDTNNETTVCGLDPGEEYLLRIQTVNYCCGENEDKPSSAVFASCYKPETGEFCVEIEDALGPIVEIISEPSVCEGDLIGELEYDNVQNSPVLYSVFFDAAAQLEGFVDIVWESFPPPEPGTVEIDIPIAASPGVYNAEFVVHNSCSNFYDFTITVSEQITSNMIEGVSPICSGEETFIIIDIVGGTPPYTVNYTDNGIDFTEVTNYENGDVIEVFPTMLTTYTTGDIIDANGCTFNSAVSIDIDVFPALGMTLLTGGGEICLGGSIDIWFVIPGGTPPYTVEYYDGDVQTVLNYESGDLISVSPTEYTEYTPFSIVDANGCSGTFVKDLATVEVFDPILDATLEGGGEICSGESSYIWFDITGGVEPYEVTYFDGLFFESVSNYFSGDLIEVMPFATTTYTPISIEDSNSCGGPVNGMAEVIVNEGPNFANLVGGDDICEGESAIIYFDIVGGQSPYYVEYYDGGDTEAIDIYESGDPIFVAPEMTTVYTPFYVTDSNGCEASVLDGEVLITVFEYPGFATLEGGGEICNGASSTIWFDIPAGTPPYYVEYFDGMDFIGVPNYMSGDPIIVSPMVTTDYFSNTVIDANGCFASIDAIVTVIVNDGPSLALIDGTQAICPDATADIFVEITGGTSPFELVLYDGDSEFIIEDYLSGELITVSPNEDTEYTILQITDANGCEANVYDGIAEITILDGPGVCTLDRLEEEICVGFSTSIFFVIESGNGPYTVTYTDEEEEFTLTDYQNGDLIPVMPTENTYYYPISVIDNDGCVGEVEGFTAVFVLQGPEEVIVEGSGALCSGEDPSISIIIDGGFPPYVISYTDGDDIFEEEDYNSGDLIYLEPEGITEYTVLSVTDDDGCMVEVNEVITLFYTENPGLATISGMASICPGEEAQIFIDIDDGTGPYSILYNNGSDDIPLDDYNSGDPINVAPGFTTEYNLVSVFDVNGCEAETTGSANIEVSEGPGLVLAEGSQTICVGDNAEISFTISSGLAPFTVVYFDGSDEITLPDYMSGDPIILSPGNTTNNIPISIVDANGCPGEFDQDIIIEVLSRPDAVMLEEEFEICRDEQIELMIMINSGEGPFTIVYNNDVDPDNMSIANFNMGESIVLTPEFSTTYTAISITDANGCEGTISGSASVIVEDPPIVDLTDQYCSEDMTTYTLEFMTDGAMFVSDIGTVVSNGGGLYTVSDIPEGMSVTISSTSMLASCLTEIIFNAPDCDCLNVDPPISGGDASLCAGDPIPELSVTVNVIETADWYDAPSNGNLLLMGSLVYTPSMAGLYYAETRDLGTDCVSLTRTGVELEINDLPNVTITGDTDICSGQEGTTLDAGSNYSSYLWSSGEDTQTIEVFSEGEYTVMVSDEFGCSGEGSITVNELDPPQVEITGFKFICEGQSTELGLGDNYETILWSTGEDTEVITVQEIGEYSVVVTDSNGCTGEANVTVDEYDFPEVIITGVASICEGQSTELGLGDSYETILWSTGEDTEVITVQEIGEYSVLVTDVNGCEGEASVVVEAFEDPQVEITGIASICEGQSTELGLDDAYESVLWSTGEDTEMITVQEPGEYSVMVTDINGCTGEASITVDEVVIEEISIIGDAVICEGAISNLSIEGDFESYMWSTGEETESISVSEEGIYSLIVMDENGCTSEAMFELMVEDGLGFETKFLANKSVCVGDTVHLFDISEIDTAADEYFWDFGDGMNSTERDPVHTYTMPGSYDVQLVATVDGCINKSIFKQIDVFDCRREIYDDSNFAYINVAPNPSDGTFSLILEFITETDALIELYTVDGILLHSEFFSGNLIRKNYDLRETGVYFIKVKTPFYSKAKKVLVHK